MPRKWVMKPAGNIDSRRKKIICSAARRRGKREFIRQIFGNEAHGRNRQQQQIPGSVTSHEFNVVEI